MESTNPHKSTSSDEIDLIDLIRHIWNGRWMIAKITLAFIVVGIVIAFTSTEQFKAEARLLPEIRDTRGGASALLRQIGGLGGLGNLSLGAEGADAIRPDLYPDVLKSTPFFVGLMEHPIKVKTEGKTEAITVFTYVDQHMSSTFRDTMMKYTFKLPWTIMDRIRGKKEENILSDVALIPQMTRAQFEAIKTLKDLIRAGIDPKTGIITISAEFPDRLVAAQIAQYAVYYLTEYITDYRIQKAQKDLLFVQTRHEEKKQEFHNAQLSLARFRDTNRNIISAAAQTEEQRLQDQYNLTFNVYNGLAQQLEQARIKVQEETPVIKVLEPVNVPVERSKPRRILIFVVFTFLGFLMASGFVFGKHLIQRLNLLIKH
jgi:uncharacterized protein involved in exopolysaccharide biosynthesis